MQGHREPREGHVGGVAQEKGLGQQLRHRKAQEAFVEVLRIAHDKVGEVLGGHDHVGEPVADCGKVGAKDQDGNEQGDASGEHRCPSAAVVLRPRKERGVELYLPRHEGEAQHEDEGPQHDDEPHARGHPHDVPRPARPDSVLQQQDLLHQGSLAYEEFPKVQEPLHGPARAAPRGRGPGLVGLPGLCGLCVQAQLAFANLQHHDDARPDQEVDEDELHPGPDLDAGDGPAARVVVHGHGPRHERPERHEDKDQLRDVHDQHELEEVRRQEACKQHRNRREVCRGCRVEVQQQHGLRRVQGLAELPRRPVQLVQHKGPGLQCEVRGPRLRNVPHSLAFGQCGENPLHALLHQGPEQGVIVPQGGHGAGRALAQEELLLLLELVELPVQEAPPPLHLVEILRRAIHVKLR
mmetsp:Transcript_106935/g.312711  ORF Transcript_106935/g.312711 Transcript_106935/m.312711 type:complete len:409 (-) Transcript_106935:234-1460(-)